MLIQIDFRETELFQACQAELVNYTHIQLETASLPLGDILLTLSPPLSSTKRDNNKTEDNKEQEDDTILLLERKTLLDLAASITDGRYEEQSYRLHGLPQHPHNIIYLIEGDVDKYKPNKRGKQIIDGNTLLSAMFSIQQYKGFSLMRTMNVKESARLICVMAQKMVTNQQKKRDLYYSTKEGQREQGEQGEGQDDKNYCTVVKQVKKDNVTASNIGEIMLCQIPHISAASAKAIMQQHGSMADLILHLQADPTCLRDISMVDSTSGTKRKINQHAIQTVSQWLSSSSSSCVERVDKVKEERPSKKRVKKEKDTNESVGEVNESVDEVKESVDEVKEKRPSQKRAKKEKDTNESVGKVKESVDGVKKSVGEVNESVDEVKESVGEVNESVGKVKEKRPSQKRAKKEKDTNESVGKVKEKRPSQKSVNKKIKSSFVESYIQSQSHLNGSLV